MEILDPAVVSHKLHTDKEKYDNHNQVQMRILFNGDLPDRFSFDFEEKPKDPEITQIHHLLNYAGKGKIRKAILHFHGGGFIAMDSLSH